VYETGKEERRQRVEGKAKTNSSGEMRGVGIMSEREAFERCLIFSSVVFPSSFFSACDKGRKVIL